jgi:RNA polymerase sigma-70 factor (ECF subfamily)
MVRDETFSANLVLTTRMQPTDDALVQLARGGDDEAFRAIFDRHHRTVYRFAYAMTGDHVRAEDVVQDTFVAAYHGLTRLRGEARLTTWLCAIARNILMKSFRRMQPQIIASEAALQPSDVMTPEARLLSEETGRLILGALLQLDEDKRTVFTLKMIEGLSYEEIASITGSAVPKLKTDLFRARARMRELLAEWKEEHR